jgi:DNA replication protein DnaC
MHLAHDTLRAILERRGTPPQAVHDLPDDPPFDPIAWRIGLYRRRLHQEVPARFAAATVNHPDIGGWVRRYVTDPAAAGALLIAGTVGVGKTWQAYGALKAAVVGAATTRRCRWLVTTHPNLNDETRPKPDDSHAWALERYMEIDLLLLDDLGAGKQSEWTSDALYRLVDHRWSQNLPTIYTTNSHPRDLHQLVGERVVSRLADASRVLLTGPDRRIAGAQR